MKILELTFTFLTWIFLLISGSSGVVFGQHSHFTVVAFVSHSSRATADEKLRATHSDDRVLSVLRGRGIDLTSESQLLEALSSSNVRVASAAAYALSRVPKTERSIHALSQAVDAENRVVAFYAAQALSELGDTSWINVAVRDLSSTQDPVAGLLMAGLLAKVGNYQGWYLIDKYLMVKPYNTVALEQAPFFAKMGRSDRGAVNVLTVLTQLLTVVDESERPFVEEALTRAKRLTISDQISEPSAR